MTQKALLFLHIGLHKTGTSSIQKFFLDNQRKFSCQGILYPEAGLSKGWYGHHDFAWSINQDSRLVRSTKNPWEKLSEEITANLPRLTLLSSECFNENFSSKELEKLREKLQPYDVRIIVYLRRQDFWFQSYYMQAVRDGQTHDRFKEFAELMRQKELGNYAPLLDLWASNFGEENLNVKIFREDTSPDKLLLDFLGLLDISGDFSQWTPPERLNVSPDVKCVRVMRFMNSAGRFLTYRQKEALYLEKLRDKKGFLYRAIAGAPDWILNSRLASSAELESIFRWHEKSNQAVARKHLKADSLF